MTVVKSSLMVKVGNVYKNGIGQIITIVDQTGGIFTDQNHNDYQSDGKSITFCDDQYADLVEVIVEEGKMVNKTSYYKPENPDFYQKVELKVTVILDHVPGMCHDPIDHMQIICQNPYVVSVETI